MKDFRSFTMVREPLEEIWATLRDRLPEIAARMDDLESVEALERSQEPGGRIRLVNRWNARQRIAPALRGAVGADSISWLDRALWDPSSHTCTWSIAPSVLPGHIECGGATRYEPAMAGRGTRVTFEGRFALRPGFLAGMPAAFEPLARSLVESIFSTMIPRNLARAVSAAAELIAAERGARRP
jgi:hypothetical protein